MIWTTTPWTIPGNRAISFSESVPYGLYRVDAVEPLPDGTRPWVKSGDNFVIADRLADEVLGAARASRFTRLGDVPNAALAGLLYPSSAPIRS